MREVVRIGRTDHGQAQLGEVIPIVRQVLHRALGGKVFHWQFLGARQGGGIAGPSQLDTLDVHQPQVDGQSYSDQQTEKRHGYDHQALPGFLAL